MKFKITMKDPGAHDCIEEEAEDQVRSLDLAEDEREAIKELRIEKLKEFASKWMEHSEYLTVEFDTEAGTCTVVEVE
jgi:hypothetical protein